MLIMQLLSNDFVQYKIPGQEAKQGQITIVCLTAETVL